MKKQKIRDIGYDFKPPAKVCEDENCPWHGTLPIRGKILEGRVVSTKQQRTIIIERNYLHYVPKYERYERRRKRMAVHKPDCIELKVGDKVRIAECRPLSKTKHFVVMEVLEK
jgi:small subunit ribosomal protein S17